MSITAIMSTYNEKNFLPLKIQWCKSNNIHLYVCDNMSTDGTWEMLQKEGIDSHQYDTNEIFSETEMQKEIRKTIEKLNPEWVLYMGCDMFFDIPEDYNNYDFVEFYYYSPKNTGEERTLPFDPFNTYHYAVPSGYINFLFRWSEDVKFYADSITPTGIGLHNKTLALNYGGTKPKEEREITKQRKMRAWENGDPVAFSSHLLTESEIDWTWDRTKLIDLSKTGHWKTIQKIANQSIFADVAAKLEK